MRTKTNTSKRSVHGWEAEWKWECLAAPSQASNCKRWLQNFARTTWRDTLSIASQKLVLFLLFRACSAFPPASSPDLSPSVRTRGEIRPPASNHIESETKLGDNIETHLFAFQTLHDANASIAQTAVRTRNVHVLFAEFLSHRLANFFQR